MKTERSKTLSIIPNVESLVLKRLHDQYIRENYDPKTKERLPNWVSESEWLMMNNG